MAAELDQAGNVLTLFQDGGAIGEAMRGFDWAGSALGLAETWPPPLVSYAGLMLAAAQPMFLAWGPERSWLYNNAFIPILGQKHPAALAQPAAQVWGEGWSRLEPLFDRVFAGEAVQLENYAVALDGKGGRQEAVFDFSYTPLRGEDGRFCGLFGIGIETTGRVEAALAAKTAELARIWDHSRDVQVVIGADGLFRAVNRAWTAILGHAPAQVIGRSYKDFIWPEDAALPEATLAAAARGEELKDLELRYRHVDGTPRWLSWHTAREGRLVYAYGRDVTAEKRAQAELAVAQEALRQSRKMEAVGQLTGGIAHDFNNLLAGISGSLEMLQRRYGEGRVAGAERFIEAAQANARRAAALTQRLLAFSRRQTLDPRPTNVNRLVSGMEELIRRSVGPAVELEVVGASGLWLTRIDPSQLENAILNLCINARDAMSPQGGRLTIETANRWLDERAAALLDVPPGQYISLSVTDTGTGMPPEVIEHVFEPFYTTKPLGQGTGLGLSMIYGFVRQSGGQVRVYSELGKGTTMCLYLRRHFGPVEARDEPAAVAAIEAAEADGGTVLVVDDEATIRMLIVEILHELGYNAMEAVDGPSGLAVLQSEARIDLLVTDVGLPGGLNGRQIADAARLSRPGLKILFITGFAENAVIGNGHLDPGMEVITKPFAMAGLAAKIRDMMAR